MAVGHAFRAFFGILFSGDLPTDVAAALGWVKRGAAAPKPAENIPVVTPADGALQILGILQRDARFVDFVMESLSGYSDEQIGAAVRNLHENTRTALDRYFSFTPLIDGVEGTYTKLEFNDPARLKLLGKVPADGKAAGGTLRHRGWRASKVDLPPIFAHQKTDVIAPAEVEIE
jgi:hypothetical protein